MKRFLVVAVISGLMSTAISAADFVVSGATFPAILLKKMFGQYEKEMMVSASYTPRGSLQGLNDVVNREVAFAVSDIPLRDTDVPSKDRFLEFPVTLGAVSIVYSLPGIPILKLTPDVISDIFFQKIVKWNDPRIQAINKAKMPDMSIKVVGRSERSGTTYILSQYLSDVSPSWNVEIGKRWYLPFVNEYVTGNAGVAQFVANNPGSIGYLEWHYAVQAGLSIAAIQNQQKRFVLPSVEAVLGAVESMTPEMVGKESLVNTKSEFGYPIVGFSWVIVEKDQSQRTDFVGTKKLVDLLWWMTHQGQLYAEESGFPALPPSAMTYASQVLKRLEFDGVIIR
ncbi:phosphate ABC transporter substrate-binding protein PstS [bacterium]|nr:phosphate ABC transporter substrate-binding protein PstS [bacterium]